MNNNYPLHIEKQLERIYKKASKRISNFVNAKILKQYKELKKQFDAKNISEIEQELNEDLINQLLIAGYAARDIKSVMKLMDAWALAKTNQAIRKMKLSAKKTGSISVEITKDNPLVKDFVEEYTKFNKSLVEQLGKEYIPEVTQLAQKAFLKGESTQSLAEALKEKAGISIRKAEFWAQDQAGDAYASFTQLRQAQAGFPGYIWRTTGDNHVRPLHQLLDGKYFTWARGAPGLEKPGAKHPGQSYRCRCTAEPAVNDQDIIKEDNE